MQQYLIARPTKHIFKVVLKVGIYFSIFLLIIDFIYKSWYGISYQNREMCVVYNFLPSVLFWIYEYFIELFLVVIVGVFVAVILERQFSKHKRFFPKNQFSAFIYASIIPVCSFSAIPMIETMKDKFKFCTLITFVVAAPLLNPYIVSLSFSVLGIKYGILRITASFVLAIITGLVVEYFCNGADVVFLQPLMKYAGLSMGSSIAFSLIIYYLEI